MNICYILDVWLFSTGSLDSVSFFFWVKCSIFIVPSIFNLHILNYPGQSYAGIYKSNSTKKKKNVGRAATVTSIYCSLMKQHVILSWLQMQGKRGK